MCFYLSIYAHWCSMATKQFITLTQGSVAAAVPLEGQVPLVLDMILDGKISPSGAHFFKALDP